MVPLAAALQAGNAICLAYIVPLSYIIATTSRESHPRLHYYFYEWYRHAEPASTFKHPEFPIATAGTAGFSHHLYGENLDQATNTYALPPSPIITSDFHTPVDTNYTITILVVAGLLVIANLFFWLYTAAHSATLINPSFSNSNTREDSMASDEGFAGKTGE